MSTSAGRAWNVDQRLDRRAGRHHRSAVALEQPAQELQRVGLVFDDQHADTVQRQFRSRVGGRPAGSRVEIRPVRHAKRQHHGERRALARTIALGAHLAAVQLDQVLDDGESEPEAAVAAGDGAIGLVETIEDVREHVGPDAAAGVGHHDGRRAPSSTRSVTRIAPLARRELDRVREQVPDHLLQPRRITGHGGAVRPSMSRDEPHRPSRPPPAPASRRRRSRPRRCRTSRSPAPACPSTMRLMSSRSETSCACRRVLRSTTSSPR